MPQVIWGGAGVDLLRSDGFDWKRRVAGTAGWLLVLLLATAAAGMTTSGSLTEDEVWSGIVEITGDVTVPHGISLTVEPGTAVRFADGTRLRVDGVLRAEGTADSPIRFGSASVPPAPGAWKGIEFGYYSQDTGRMRHCMVEDAVTGISSSAAGPDILDSTIQRCVTGIQLGSSSSTSRISGCIIRENREYAILGFLPGNAAPIIENNHIARCRRGIDITGGYGYSDPVIRNNIVRDNTEAGIQVDYVRAPEIRFNTVVGNDRGIEAHGVASAAVVSSNIVAWNIVGMSFSAGWWGSCALGHNDFWANDLDYLGVAAGPGDIAADPQFTGGHDFRLAPGSPCIDSGDPEVPDPDGSPPDMGAYGAGGSPPEESGNSAPERPVNVSPADSDLVDPSSTTLSATPFSDPDSGDAHAASRWQVRSASGTYAEPLFETGVTAAHLTGLPLPPGTLEPETTHFFRVRYQDSRSGWSAYSQETSFRTPRDVGPPETLITWGAGEGQFVGTSAPSFGWRGEDVFRGPLTYSWAMDSEESRSPFDPSTGKQFSGLSEGPHALFVRARDASGNVDPTPAVRNFIVDTQAPAITNVRVSEISPWSALITWETHESATSRVRYRVKPQAWNETALDGSLVTTHVVLLEDLLYNTTYEFSVESRDAAGNLKTSETFTFVTVPAVERLPPETAISGGPQSGALLNTRNVTFTWRGSDDVTSPAHLTYAVQVDSGGWSSFSSATSRSLVNLSDGPHTFEVKARDQSGKVDPTPAARSFTIDATPPAPASDFTAEPRVGGAELSWAHSPSPDVATYRVYWDAGRGEIDHSSPLAAAAHPERTLSVALEQRGTYRFGLRAVDLAGNEEKNATLVAAVALTRPDAPTVDAVLSPTTAASQVLSGGKEPGTSLWVNGREVVPVGAEASWSYTVSLVPGVNRFEITCRSGSGEESPPRTVLIECDPLPLPVTTLRIHDPGTGTSVILDWTGYDEASQGDIRHYRIYRSSEPFSTTEGISPSATVPAGVFTHAVTGLPRGLPVWLAVTAVDVRGGASPTVAPAAVVPEDLQPPEAPSNLSVECFEDRLLLSWSPSADAAQDLSGYRMVFNGEPEPRGIPRDRTSFEVAGLAPATAYPVRLTAVDASGNESPAVSIQAVTLLQNPAGVTAEPQDGRVNLAWRDSTPRSLVARYLVYVSPSPFTSVRGMTPRTQASSNSAAVSGLDNGTTYHLAVTAVNTSGGERQEVTCVSATPRGDREGPSLSDVRFDGAPIGSGAVLRRSGTFSVAVSDPSGVSRVELLIDGALRHTDAGGSGRTHHPWDILSVPDGPHVFTFRAADTFGNASRLELSLRVETEPPGTPVIEAPAPGTLTREPAVSVSGRAEPGSEVLLYLNGVQTGSPTAVSPPGVFKGMLPLGEGENRIQAAARNRGGTGPRSAAVTVTRDSTLPEPPKNLSAELISGGSVRLAWRTPAESGLRGFNLYRAGGPFESPSEAVRINGLPVSGTTFEHLPPGDGAYVFRATAVDLAGNESGLSNSASVVIDRTPPRATAVTFTPSGPFDPASGRMGPGTRGRSAHGFRAPACHAVSECHPRRRRAFGRRSGAGGRSRLHRGFRHFGDDAHGVRPRGFLGPGPGRKPWNRNRLRGDSRDRYDGPLGFHNGS